MKMDGIWKRVLSTLLVCALLIGMLPQIVVAQDTNTVPTTNTPTAVEVPNGDFEEGTPSEQDSSLSSGSIANFQGTGWTVSRLENAIDINLAAGAGRNESQAIKIQGASDGTNRGEMKVSVNVEANSVYFLSAWVKIDNTQTGSVNLYVQNAPVNAANNKAAGSGMSANLNADDWTPIQLCFSTLEAGAIAVVVYCAGLGQNGYITVDDVELIKVSSANETAIDWNGGAEAGVADVAVDSYYTTAANSYYNAYLPACRWTMRSLSKDAATGAVIVDEGARTGTKAIKLYGLDVTKASRPYLNYVIPSGSYVPGATYHISVWVKGVSGTGANKNNGVIKIDMTNDSATASVTNAADWTELTVTNVAPNSGNFTININVSTGVYDAYWLLDDLTITKAGEAKSVTLDKTSVTLKEGEFTTLTPTLNAATGDTIVPESAGNVVTYSSSNTSVATVDTTGKVTAVGEGKTIITATTGNGRTAGCLITVSNMGENLLTNGDFETGTPVSLENVTATTAIGESGWEGYGTDGNMNFALVAGVGRNNSQAIQAKTASAGRGYIRTTVDVEANSVYFLTAWAKIDSAQTTANVDLYATGTPVSGTGQCGRMKAAVCADQWFQLYTSFITGSAGTATIVFNIPVVGTNGYVTVDDVQLFKISDSYGTTVDWNGDVETAVPGVNIDAFNDTYMHTTANRWWVKRYSASVGGASRATVVTGAGREGSNAIKISATDGSVGSRPALAYTIPTGSYEPGAEYEISVWVKAVAGTDNSKNTAVRFDDFTVDRQGYVVTHTGDAHNVTSASNWVELKATATAPTNTSKVFTIVIKANSNIGDDYYLFDDLTITKVVNVAVEGVAIEDATLQVGTTHTLVPTFTPANATNQNVSYESSNPAVATVDANGVVTALKVGTATITVTTEDGNKTDTCVITVDPNLVINGDFETGTAGTATAVTNTANIFGTGWRANGMSGSADYALTAGAGRDNSQAIQVKANTANSRAEMKLGVEVEANAVYYATAWVKIDSDQTGGVNLYVDNGPLNSGKTGGSMNGGKTAGAGTSYAVSKGQWVPISVSFTTMNAGEIVLAVYCSPMSTTGYITVDNVSLVKVSDSYGATADWNGGFESAIVNSPIELAAGGGTHHTVANGWRFQSASETSGAVVVTDAVHSGTKAMKLYSVDTTKAAKPYISYVMPAGSLEAETDYDVALWVKGVPGTGSNKNSGSIRIVSGTVGAGNVISCSLTIAAEWVKISSRFTSDANGALTLNFEASGLYDGYFLIDDLTVTKVVNIAVEGVSIEDATMKVGTTHTLAPTFNPTNATNQNVSYESSNPAVATVDANGVVTALKVGSATITVTTEDGGKTDTCVITVDSNLIVNDSFNADEINTTPAQGTTPLHIANWTAWTGDSSRVDVSTVANVGRNDSTAVRISRTEGHASSSRGEFKTTIPAQYIEANAVYMFSAWIKQETGTSVSVYMKVNGTQLGTAASPYTNSAAMVDGWQRISVPFVAKASESLTPIIYFGNLTTGALLIDDIRLEKIGTAGTGSYWDGDFETAILNAPGATKSGASVGVGAALNWVLREWKGNGAAAGAHVEAGVGIDGSNALKLYSVTTDTGARPCLVYQIPEGAYEYGERYRVTLWVKTVNGTSGKSNGTVALGNSGSVFDSVGFNNAADWTKLTAIFTAPEDITTNNAQYFEILLRTNSELYDGYILVDDMQIEQLVNIPVNGISLDKTAVTLKVGAEDTLVPIVDPVDASNVAVTFTSSNPAVVAVDANTGKITALKVGSATITVTTEDGGKTASCLVTVDSNLLPNDDFELGTPGTNTTENGNHVESGATGWKGWAGDLSQMDFSLVEGAGRNDSRAIKLARNANYTEQNARGYLYTANKFALEANATYEFSVWIKACDGVTGNINLYVSGQNTGKIGKVSSEYVDISDMGEDTWYELKYIFTTRDVPETISAHVYVGHMNVGYYLVDDICLEKIADFPVEKLELNMDSTIISIGNTETLVATVTPSYALDRDVTFTSSNPNVASVDETGKITALAVGTTTITATAGGKSATCAVEVEPYDPNLVQNGYFEKGTEEIFTNTAGSSTAPTNVRNWGGWAGAGSMSFQKVLEGRPNADGEATYAMKVFRTPDCATVSRGEMIQTIPAEKLEAGKYYKLTMWVKSVGMTNNGTAWIQYAHKNGSFVKMETMRGKYIDQWTQIVAYIEGEGKDLTLYFKWEGLEGGYYLVDNVVLEPWVLVDEVTLPHNKFYLEPGQTANMAATITPAVTSDNTIHYSSTDETVVTVDENGQITAVGTGVATITATAANGGKFADCEIHVVENYVPLTALNIPTSLNLIAGAQSKLNLTYNPAEPSDKIVTWSSSDESVAVVTENGLVTALGAGTATITVVGENGISAQCTVTVTQSTTLTAALAQFTTGYGQKLSGNLSASVTNNTGASATYTLYQAPANGYMVLNADGSFTYVPKSNFDISQPDTFIVLVSAGGQSTLLNGTITVESILENIRENVKLGMTLMTTEEKLEYIRAEIAKEGSVHNKIWQRVKKDVDKIMAAPIPQYDQYTDEENYWAMWQRPVGTQIATMLFGTLIAESEAYKAKTIEYAVTSANYDTWAEWEYYQQADLAGGHQGYAIALVYNWLHDDMTEQQRGDIIRRLYQTCERVENKWGDSTQFMQNHLWVALSALNASSLALYVYPEEVAAAVSQIEGYETITAAQVKENCERWIALCAQKIGRSFEVMPSDGTNHEGPGYHSYGLEYLLKNAILLNDCVDVDMFTNNKWLQNNSEYLLNIMVPAGDMNGSTSAIDYANSIRGFWYGPSMLYRTLAGIYKDETAQWIAQIFEDTNSDCSGSSLWMSLLYTDPSVEAVSPAEQANKSTLWYADDMDIVVSRTNWTGKEAMVFMRCGLPLGKTAYELISGEEHINSSNEAHSDPDDNGLILFYNGEFLLKTDGVTTKYTGNFSTLMVDGVGQLGTERDVISGFKDADFIKYNARPYMKKTESTATYDYFVGDATEAYLPTLGIKKFERNVVLLKEENVLLVVDNIITTNNESKLELRWFPENKTISEGFGIYTIYGNKNDMKFFPFTKEGVTTEFKDLGVYLDTATMTTEKAFQQLKTGSKWQNAVAFSWSAKEEEQAMVRYMAGDNHKHLFEVNGKIYTVDVRNNTVSVANGALDVVDPWASNSELSEILFGGIAMEGFQSDVLTYTMEKNWKTEEVVLMPIAKSPTAEVEVDWDGSCPGTIEITCTSQDGTSVSNYVINLTNDKGLLSIHSASSDKNVSVPIECTYDNFLQTKGSDRTWASTGLPTVIFDMGRLVDISKIDIAFNYSDRRDTYYDFYTSIDGVEWTLVQKDGIALRTAADGPRNDYRTVAEDVGQARYLKFYLRGNSTGKQGPNGDGWDDATAYNSIQEISVYGTEVELDITPDPDIIVEDTTATITGNGVNNAITAAGNKNQVVLDVEGVDDAVVKVILPVEELKAIAEAEKSLTVKTGQATVTFDNAALAAITTAAGNKPAVELTVVPVELEDLKADQVEALKDYNVALTFAVTLACDREVISTFGNGKVTVQIPFTPEEGALASEYRIAYIADDGKVEILETVSGDGYLEVTLEHFSDYAIVRIQEKVPATGDMQLPLMMLAVLTVSLVAVLAVLVMQKKRYF